MVDVVGIVVIPIVVAVIGGVGVLVAWHFLKNRIERNPESQFDLTRYHEKGGQYGSDFVRIQNTGTKSIDGCLISWNDHDCRWWDDKEGPRLIAPGGGANAVLPNRYEVNSTITVKSRDRILRKVKYFDITPAT